MNEEQREYWNGPGGQRWTELQNALDRALRAFGSEVLDAAAVSGGENVLDVGCGCGDSTLALAERTGPSGSVLGIDVSRPMLARARERTAHLGNVRFMEADATNVDLPPDYDLMFSRFGVMFFEDPTATFANLRKALRPNGRVTFICWRPFVENRWNTVAVEAVRAVVPDAVSVTDPEAPGPYSFGDRDRVTRVLTAAGYRSIAIDPFDAEVLLSETDLESAVDFSVNVGPIARLLASAAPEIVLRVREEMRKALALHRTASGYALGGSSWLVRARHS